MKPILYVGAALMIGASIYGFVDYNKASHKKEFTGMYESKEIKTPVADEEKAVIVAEEKLPVATAETKTDPVPVAKKETATVAVKHAAKKFTKTKRKKLNYELFSRAPLREEREIIEVKPPEPPKAEIKKQR